MIESRTSWCAAALASAAIAACGGGDDPDGPRPLVPDPAVVTGCVPGPVGAGVTRAKPVACPEELIGGRLAGGRVGDLVIENERVRVIVRAAGEGYYMAGSRGGGIVDAAVVGGEDLVKEIFPAVDFAAGGSDELVITEAGDDGAAEIVVRGPAVGLDILTAALAHDPPPVIVEHHYRLAAGDDALELETRVFPSDGAATASATLYDAVFVGGRVASAPAGTGPSELVATSGTTTSYGLLYPAGTYPQATDLAGIRLIAGPTIDTAGQVRWLVIGDGSMSSVTDSAWRRLGATLGSVSGTTAPGVDVVVRSTADQSVTVARADAAGAFHVALPPADYTVAAEALGRDPGARVPATVAANADTPVTVPAGPGGTLSISVRDDGGAPVPARVSIERSGVDRRLAWVGASGDATFAIAPGAWRVAVSRGLEYDAVIADPVMITDGQTTPLSITLAHVVDTAGWISLDTHLHSELSTDSTFPVDDRLRAVAGEGVEVPVSSDHDFVFDYAPVIEELGLTAWLGSLTGEEASSIVWGHLNAWPLAPDPARAGLGAARWLDRTPGEVFTALRAGDANRIVQANHPRKSGSLFDAIDLDPATLTARRDPTDLGLPGTADLSDLSFDAVEIANALSDEDFEAVFADWLALVAAGHPAAGTGSSDSHGPTAYAGEARTYVWVGPGNDDPALADPVVINDAIRARHVVVGTGAFVTAGIVTGTATSLPGDTVDVPTGAPVTIHVRVQAAAWQALARIHIYQGTTEAMIIPLDVNETAPIRYDGDVTLPAPTADTFWVIRVDPDGEGPPVIDTPLPAFTNPLFVHLI